MLLRDLPRQIIPRSGGAYPQLESWRTSMFKTPRTFQKCTLAISPAVSKIISSYYWQVKNAKIGRHPNSEIAHRFVRSTRDLRTPQNDRFREQLVGYDR